MTNNQRLLAELAVLLLMSGVIYAKAAPARQDKQTAPEVIRAQQFELVDQNGKPYAILARKEIKKGPDLLGVLGFKGTMTMFSLVSRESKKKGIPAGVMSMGGADNGMQFFTMSNPVTNTAIMLSLDPGGTPVIRLGMGGKTRVITPQP